MKDITLKKILLILSSTLLSSSLLVACGGGGGGGGGSGGYNGSFADDPAPQGGPYPESGSYNGFPYSILTQPSDVNGGVLSKSYPNSYFPNGLPNSLQIAYGNNDESRVANISAYVTMTISSRTFICSATPVYFDTNSQTTFLIGAAHCFVDYKNSLQTLSAANMVPLGQTSVKYGVYGSSPIQTYGVKAVYLRQDYCYGSTFPTSYSSECPNFSPSSGANTQGNDIAVIQVNGKYGNPESYPYPQVVPASEYPTPYTMAPVLSIGYGINTQTPTASDVGGKSVMYYVAGYQYWQQDLTNGSNNGGYHYLYNSYYNQSAFNQSGYSALICGGDSGGGDLFWTGSKWILLSEHTYGPSNSCGTFYNYLPNGATNVSAYYDWIQAIIHDPNDTPATSCNNGTIPNCVTNG